MPIQTSGGAITHFLRAGHGPQEALLLHCMLAHSRGLEPLMAKLSDSLSMLAMDLPGHGMSEDWDTSRDYAEMTRDMALGLLERPAHLIGHSFGAYTALRIAIEQPEMVRSLTLIEPVFSALLEGRDKTAYARGARGFMGAIAVGDMISAARAFTADWGDGSAWESQKPEAMEYIVARMPLIAATDPALNKDNGGLLTRLGEVSVPCLLIEGAASHPSIAPIMAGLKAGLPDARHNFIDGAGHMAPFTHHAELAELIADFVGDQPLSAEII